MKNFRLLILIVSGLIIALPAVAAPGRFSMKCELVANSGPRVGPSFCRASASICLEARPGDGGCVNPDSLHIECDDGFIFSDFAARNNRDTEALAVSGNLDIFKAKLQISHFDGKPDTLDASLQLSSDDEEFSPLFGSCDLTLLPTGH